MKALRFAGYLVKRLMPSMIAGMVLGLVVGLIYIGLGLYLLGFFVALLLLMLGRSLWVGFDMQDRP